MKVIISGEKGEGEREKSGQRIVKVIWETGADSKLGGVVAENEIVTFLGAACWRRHLCVCIHKVGGALITSKRPLHPASFETKYGYFGFVLFGA